MSFKEEVKRRERENLMKATEQCKGKIYGPDGAAAMLGMTNDAQFSDKKDEPAKFSGCLSSRSSSQL